MAAAVVEGLGQAPVQHREAVTGLKGSLDLKLHRARRTTGGVDQLPEQAVGVESLDLTNPLELSRHETVPKTIVRLHCMNRGRHKSRILLPQQKPSPTHGLRYCCGRERDHGHSCGHRLEKWDTETFMRAQGNEHAT